MQTYEIVKLLRRYNPTPRKILVHPHSGNGLEDAAMIDAILGGADGIWAALTPHGGQIGHGSSLMLLSNLLRAGNLHIKDTYALERLMHTAEEMSKIHTGGEGIDKNYPVVSELAYCYIDRNFLQRDRACDLPPESIGRSEGWRLTCQSASNIDPLSACNIDPLSGTAEVVPVVNRGDPSGFV